MIEDREREQEGGKVRLIASLFGVYNIRNQKLRNEENRSVLRPKSVPVALRKVSEGSFSFVDLILS